jgi:hypothetical protein
LPLKESRDCAAECVRNRPGQAAPVQSGTNRSRAIALVPHTLGIVLGRRSEDVALGAVVGSARRQLLHEPVGQVEPTIGRFALCATQVDASAPKVDVLLPNAPGFVDPGPPSCQERNEICRRTPLASGAGIQPGLASRKKCCVDDVVSFAACHGPSVVALI